jgi:hypothetical protein
VSVAHNQVLSDACSQGFHSECDGWFYPEGRQTRCTCEHHELTLIPTCPHCGGSGFDEENEICEACIGEGLDKSILFQLMRNRIT